MKTGSNTTSSNKDLKTFVSTSKLNLSSSTNQILSNTSMRQNSKEDKENDKDKPKRGYSPATTLGVPQEKIRPIFGIEDSKQGDYS